MEICNNYTELIQGADAEEKLKNSINIIESLEKETFKLRAEIKRSENVIKKLQESSSLSAQNQHNTSSLFSLPSEFKKTWETLIQENVLDLFSDFLNSHKNFVQLVQVLIKVVLEEENKAIDDKVRAVLDLLGCGVSNYENIKKCLLRLFQDHSATAFAVKLLDGVKEKYLQRVPEELKKDAKKIVEMEEFEYFLLNMHKIALHMLLNDPKLEIPFTQGLEYVVLNKPDEFYCIDGFPNGAPQAVVVVPSVVRNNYPYNGIKPSVLIVSKNDLDGVNHKKEYQKIEKCEINQEKYENYYKQEEKYEKYDKNNEKCEIYDTKEDKKYKKEENYEKNDIKEDKNDKKEDKNNKKEDKNDKNDKKEVETDKKEEKNDKKEVKTDKKEAEKASDTLFTEKKPLSPKKTLIKELSPSQVIDLYCRYKKNIHKNKYEDNQDVYPPLQHKSKDLNILKCSQCKANTQCAWCSKSSLLGLVKRAPLAANSQRNLTPNRGFNNSIFETPGKTNTRTMTSLLTKRLSEAAKKMDRKAFIKNKHIDKESCKVM